MAAGDWRNLWRKFPVVSRNRRFGSEKLLTASELAEHPDAPIKRCRETWRVWLAQGVLINDVLRSIPTQKVQGRRLTSLEAVMEVIGDYRESELPQKRRARA